MDAEAMVDNAPAWKYVPPSTSCSSTQIDVNTYDLQHLFTIIYHVYILLVVYNFALTLRFKVSASQTRARGLEPYMVSRL